jgi:pyruvate dehydrogenase E2 component (dihydrolipoamide acetyltransferase)
VPVDLVMPRLSDTMTEGTVARWLKRPGETVKRGEPLAEIETDKATMPMEAFEDGTMGPVDVPEGQTVPLGSKIGVLYRPGESSGAAAPPPAPPGQAESKPPAGAKPGAETAPAAGDAAAAPPPAPAPSAAAGQPPAAPPSATAGEGSARASPPPGERSEATPGEPEASGGRPGRRDGPQGEAGGRPGQRDGPPGHAPSPQSTATSQQQPVGPSEARPGGLSDGEAAGGKLRASPLAKRIAEEHGLDITVLQGTGPGGRIVRADVLEALAKPQPQAAQPQAPTTPPPAGELKPFTRIQSVVARRMVESKTTVPHIYLTVPIDMARAMQLRADSNEYLGKERAFSVNDLFVKAAALALRQHPVVNAAYAEGGIQFNPRVNVGNAVAVPNGLVVPVIRDADRKSLPELGAEIRALAEKARSGKLALADYEGGTFTISNLGMYGVEEFDAVVNPPQSAILAVGAVMDEAVVVDGQVVPGKRCRVTLSADHRVVYGADAADFLKTLKGLLEAPLSLVY